MKSSGYIRGSLPDVLWRLRYMLLEAQQLLRDKEDCNDNNPAFRDCPMDTGANRVFIRRIQDVVDQIERDGFVDERLFEKLVGVASKKEDGEEL